MTARHGPFHRNGISDRIGIIYGGQVRVRIGVRVRVRSIKHKPAVPLFSIDLETCTAACRQRFCLNYKGHHLIEIDHIPARHPPLCVASLAVQ